MVDWLFVLFLFLFLTKSAVLKHISEEKIVRTPQKKEVTSNNIFAILLFELASCSQNKIKNDNFHQNI